MSNFNESPDQPHPYAASTNPAQPVNPKPAELSNDALKHPWFRSEKAFNLFMPVDLEIEDHDYVQEAVVLVI